MSVHLNESGQQVEYRPPPFPFIVACGRSGTTLLRAILDSHPDMAIPPETHFVAALGRRRRRYERPGGFDRESFILDLLQAPALQEPGGPLVALGLAEEEARAAFASRRPESYGDAVRCLFQLYANKRGKSRYGNKTPVHVLSLPLLVELVPEASFIHVIRDGRDVALSYLDLDFGPNTLEEAALRWKRHVRRGRNDGRSLGPSRYVEVRYEDLVSDTERTVRSMCTFVGLSYEPEMLRFHERAESIWMGLDAAAHRNLDRPPTQGLRDWRSEMTRSEVALFETLAGDLLVELGYERAIKRPSTAQRVRARGRASGAETRRAARAVATRLRRVRNTLVSRTARAVNR
ncbi:MAG: sulfotransferase family protein [Actinomycetota bacterium]